MNCWMRSKSVPRRGSIARSPAAVKQNGSKNEDSAQPRPPVETATLIALDPALRGYTPPIMGLDLYAYLPPWRQDPTLSPQQRNEIESRSLDDILAILYAQKPVHLALPGSEIHLVLETISVLAPDACPLITSLSQRICREELVLPHEQVTVFAAELARFSRDCDKYHFFDLVPTGCLQKTLDDEFAFLICPPRPLRADLWSCGISSDDTTAWYVATDGSSISILTEPWPHPYFRHTPVTEAWPHDGTRPFVHDRLQTAVVCSETKTLSEIPTGKTFPIGIARFGDGPIRPHRFPLSRLLALPLEGMLQFAQSAAAEGRLMIVRQ